MIRPGRLRVRLALMIPWMRARWAARNKRAATDEKQTQANGAERAACSSGITTGGQVEHNARQTISQDKPNRSSNTTRTAECSSSEPQVHSKHALTPQPRRLSKLKTARRPSTSSSSYPDSVINSAASSDENLDGLPVTKERIKVRIICPSARVLSFQTDVNKRLAELKNEVILELSDDPASMPLFATDVRQLSPRYRLFRAEYQGVELNEALTLVQLNIADNAMLVLVPRRQYLQQMTSLTRDVQAPREIDIETATRNVLPRIVDMPMVDINEIFQQSNLQFDVRKVLISLAQASAAIIGTGPYANRLIAMLKQKLINKRNYQNDTLQCLVDMGFKKEKAEYALKINHGVYSAALEWLIQHQSDDSPLEEAAMGMQKSQSVISPSGIITNDSIIENSEALLEIVRIYSHRDIPPTPETVGALVEMGFEETDVLLALKKTCNNKAAACEWLCGNRSGSLIELRDGLAQDSPILKSILEMPQVQMNLSNPKILLAFLSILENENSIRVWGGDNDTTSVITHILQKYHEEKHVLGINQFYSNRQ